MLSAALSTASSIIAVISSTTRTDLFRGTAFEEWLFVKMPFLRQNFNRFLSLISGIICYICAVGIAALGSTVIKLAMTNFGVCGGPILGVFCLAFVEESTLKVTSLGAFVGLAVGLSVTGILGFGSVITAIWRIPFLWMTLIGTSTTFFVGLFGKLLFFEISK